MRSLDVFFLYQESQHKQCFLAFLENQERQESPYLDGLVEKYLRAILDLSQYLGHILV